MQLLRIFFQVVFPSGIVLAVPLLGLVRMLGALCSKRIRGQVRAHPILHGIWFLVTIVFVGWFFTRGTVCGPPSDTAEKWQVERQVNGVTEALERYTINMGQCPGAEMRGS